MSHPQEARQEFHLSLGGSWDRLANVLGIPADDQRTFRTGRESYEVWHWLEENDRLADLPASLRRIGRAGLARLFDTRPVAWPIRIGLVPQPPDCRQNRVVDTDLAAANLGTSPILVGLGGVGKSHLAAAFAERLWNERAVDLLVWVNASSRRSVVETYTQAAAALTEVADTNHEAAVGRFLTWLRDSDGRHWLVVLDDVNDPADLTGLWPPAGSTGRTVVTTRRRDAALVAGRQIVRVDAFTPDEAHQYLRQKLEEPWRLDDVAGLATDLGYLPLALAQAASYILDRNLTCRGYRHRFANSRRRLTDLAPDLLPDQHQATVAATWSVSIDHASKLAPRDIARPLLELASLLHHDGIPGQLFMSKPVIEYCAKRTARTTEADDIHDGMYLLHRFNLAIIDEPTDTLRVHNLVQRAVRENIDPVGLTRLAVAAADALDEIWPDFDKDGPLEQVLRQNMESLDSHAGSQLWSDGAHPVLSRVGNNLGYAGSPTAATSYFDELCRTATRELGADHPDTLAVRHDLAHWQGQSGDQAGAVRAYEALVADRSRILGSDHPDTLTARHNLAAWRGEAGDLAGAVATYATLVSDRGRILGPDHPDTLTTRHNLAHWQGLTGDVTGAMTMLEAVFQDRRRTLGPDHPDTLLTRQNLYYWLGHAGQPARAAEEYSRLLDARARLLGRDHPDTLATRHLLAEQQGLAGNPMSAAAAFRALLPDQARVLGFDHPDAQATRARLSYWRGRIPEKPVDDGEWTP